KLFAIYFKFRGLSAKGLDSLHALGLTMSGKWTGDAVGRISAESRAAMKRLMGLFPWLMSCDNVLITFQVFAQRVDRKTTRGNGTAGIVYLKRSAKPLPSTISRAVKEMRRAGMANPLKALDIFDIALAANIRCYPHTVYLVLKYHFDTLTSTAQPINIAITHCCNVQHLFANSYVVVLPRLVKSEVDLAKLTYGNFRLDLT
ncbi:hypothetical protein B0H19DRAFT_947423, partial [Mycena capillaripes]